MNNFKRYVILWLSQSMSQLGSSTQVCHLLITYIIKYFLILQGFPCFFLRLML